MKTTKPDYPDGLWLRCESCKEILYKKTIERNYYVCPHCAYHFRISAKQYFSFLLDNPENSFDLSPNLTSSDPLAFPKYKEKLVEVEEKSGLKEGYIYTRGKIDNKDVVFGAMDFNFMGGSMGSVVGAKFVRGVEFAIEKKIPFISVAASGGARMQESIVSLMQMAKTAIAVDRLNKAGILYISVLTDPTMGGVSASFAFLGDIIIAEPESLIGFAGPRVIEQTIRQQLPEGFQKAEFLLEKGQIDMVVDRKNLKKTIYTLIKHTHG